MIRRLMVFLLGVVGFLLFRRVIRHISDSMAPKSGARSAVGRNRDSGAQLVRDRVCNTFIPRTRAIECEIAGQTHFFCSQECRTRFLAEPSDRGGNAAVAS